MNLGNLYKVAIQLDTHTLKLIGEGLGIAGLAGAGAYGAYKAREAFDVWREARRRAKFLTREQKIQEKVNKRLARTGKEVSRSTVKILNPKGGTYYEVSSKVNKIISEPIRAVAPARRRSWLPWAAAGLVGLFSGAELYNAIKQLKASKTKSDERSLRLSQKSKK